MAPELHLQFIDHSSSWFH